MKQNRCLRFPSPTSTRSLMELFWSLPPPKAAGARTHAPTPSCTGELRLCTTKGKRLPALHRHLLQKRGQRSSWDCSWSAATQEDADYCIYTEQAVVQNL